MRFALGLVCLNEAPWLRLHLPVILQSRRIDGVVCIDGGSTDKSRDVVADLARGRMLPCEIEVRPWDWDFAAQQNAVVQLAERLGYDAYFKYDPDELMFPEHIDQAADLLASGAHKVVIVSRYNFEGDRRHYCPYLYPDKQLRFVVLNQGFYWYRRLHATTNAYTQWHEPAGTSVGIDRPIVWLPHARLYHYEGIKPMAERALKWLNYERIQAGDAPLTALPDGYKVPSSSFRYKVEFRGVQPLDPAVCGVEAPVRSNYGNR